MEARTQTPGRRQFGRHVRLGRLSETHQKGNRRQGEEERKKEKLSSYVAPNFMEFGGPLWVIKGRIWDVCFTPKSGHAERRDQSPLSANSGLQRRTRTTASSLQRESPALRCENLRAEQASPDMGMPLH